MGAQRFIRQTAMRRFAVRARPNTISTSTRFAAAARSEGLEIYKRRQGLNAENLEKGINQTNVWRIPDLNGNSRSGFGTPDAEAKGADEAVVRFRCRFQGRGPVLEVFAGSGVTTRVAVETGRHSFVGLRRMRRS